MPKTKRMREMLKTRVDDVTAWGKSQKLENISSRGSPHHRRSPSMATAATNGLPSLELLAYALLPRRLTLAPHQYKYCSLALKFFKDKLRMPEQIKQEWDQLDAIYIIQSEAEKRCTVALNNFNFSKNRYDDYVAFDENRVVLNYSAAGDYINASSHHVPLLLLQHKVHFQRPLRIFGRWQKVMMAIENLGIYIDKK